MSEIELPVRTYGVDYICDMCNKGRMRPHNSTALMSNPPKFPHQCNNPECKAIINLSDRYPTIRHSITLSEGSENKDEHG